jgi:hypothetical protein
LVAYNKMNSFIDRDRIRTGLLLTQCNIRDKQTFQQGKTMAVLATTAVTTLAHNKRYKATSNARAAHDDAAPATTAGKRRGRQQRPAVTATPDGSL